jgi:Flp pilus assembly protein TadB
MIINELIPASPSLRGSMGRLDSGGGRADRYSSLPVRLGHRLATGAPWLPVPIADLRLLGQDPAAWLARKLGFALLGLALVPALSELLALTDRPLPWMIPASGTLALGGGMFFVPDVVTRVSAKQRRSDFRHALTSFLDLVALERGAGAAPTEALEAAANVGGGWAFACIGAALDEARKASRPPWDGLARLADDLGVVELHDLAEIAEVAGQEGARILQTLNARADAMRAQALAATRAQAGARSTTMVLPIALLAAGFLMLLIFPDFYRLFG